MTKILVLHVFLNNNYVIFLNNYVLSESSMIVLYWNARANPVQWIAAVQFRQHASHRHTFYYLKELNVALLIFVPKSAFLAIYCDVKKFCTRILLIREETYIHYDKCI